LGRGGAKIQNEIPDSQRAGNNYSPDIIVDFAKLDPQSFSYRYPVDREGKLLELGQDQLDLSMLADVMKGLEGYFNGCDGWLHDLQSNSPTEY
jgi:hypothetical protein